MEVWKSSELLPEYEASSRGRVRRVPHNVPMPNGGYKICGGYAWAGTCTSNDPRPRILFKGKNYKVAHLVCEAFHGKKPFLKAVVMHKDDNPRNNHQSNLRWGTQKDNLNTESFLEYCRSRLGARSPRVIHKRRLADSTATRF